MSNNKEITVSNFVNLANECVGIGLLLTGEKNFELANELSKQKVGELLDEVKGVRMFFYKNSPVTELMDKIILTYEQKIIK